MQVPFEMLVYTKWLKQQLGSRKKKVKITGVIAGGMTLLLVSDSLGSFLGQFVWLLFSFVKGYF